VFPNQIGPRETYRVTGQKIIRQESEDYKRGGGSTQQTAGSARLTHATQCVGRRKFGIEDYEKDNKKKWDMTDYVGEVAFFGSYGIKKKKQTKKRGENWGCALWGSWEGGESKPLVCVNETMKGSEGPEEPGIPPFQKLERG